MLSEPGAVGALGRRHVRRPVFVLGELLSGDRLVERGLVPQLPGRERGRRPNLVRTLLGLKPSDL